MIMYVGLSKRKLSRLPISYHDIPGSFDCSRNELTSLEGAPKKWVGGYFDCSRNKLTTLDHLPKYIGADLLCHNNPLQNLNGLKDVEIRYGIVFPYDTEKQLDYWIKALYNTDLDALEWHYANHRYNFWANNLENYVMNELEEIIKVKRLKRDLNV